MRISKIEELVFLDKITLDGITCNGTLLCRIDADIENRGDGKAVLPVIEFALKEDEGLPEEEETVEFICDAGHLIVGNDVLQLSCALQTTLPAEEIIGSAIAAILAQKLALTITLPVGSNDIKFHLEGENYSEEVSMYFADFAHFFCESKL